LVRPTDSVTPTLIATSHRFRHPIHNSPTWPRLSIGGDLTDTLRRPPRPHDAARIIVAYGYLPSIAYSMPKASLTSCYNPIGCPEGFCEQYRSFLQCAFLAFERKIQTISLQILQSSFPVRNI
jgi:hypothetical protein